MTPSKPATNPAGVRPAQESFSGVSLPDSVLSEAPKIGLTLSLARLARDGSKAPGRRVTDSSLQPPLRMAKGFMPRKVMCRERGRFRQNAAVAVFGPIYEDRMPPPFVLALKGTKAPRVPPARNRISHLESPA
jgi:hypothetical protein